MYSLLDPNAGKVGGNSEKNYRNEARFGKYGSFLSSAREKKGTYNQECKGEDPSYMELKRGAQVIQPVNLGDCE